MDIERLEKLALQYQRRADNDYQKYQETAERRYYSSFEKNEDTAAAIRAAIAADDTLNAYSLLKHSMANFAKTAEALLAFPDEKETQQLIKDIAAYGKAENLIS